jgi:hypothetical protein
LWKRLGMNAPSVRISKSMTEARHHRAGELFVILLLGLVITTAHFQALAQADEGEWSAPVNLSHSGAASGPALVSTPQGMLRIFWWDRFDGLMLSQGDASSLEKEAWSESKTVPIYVATTKGDEVVFEPIQAMPRIVGDVSGQAHAFWLGEADEETGERPLLHSQLATGATAWSSPVVADGSASEFVTAAEPTGGLHLVYVRPSHTSRFPAGVYYRRLDSSGTSWSASKELYGSAYYRLILPQDDSDAPSRTAHLRLSANDFDRVVVTWDDPRLEQLMFTYSVDGGTTWEEPDIVGDRERQLQRGRVFAMPGGQTWLLWEDTRVKGTCGLYQDSIEKLLTGKGVAQQVLEGLTACTQGEKFWPLDKGGVLMVADNGSDALTLSMWDGSTEPTGGGIRWSEPKRLSFHFVDPELGEQVRLGDLQAALVHSARDEQNVETLIVVGTDQNGEVWVMGSPVDMLDLTSARSRHDLTSPAPSDYTMEGTPSAPVNLSHSRAASSPAIVAGPDSTLRVLWWDQFDGLTMADGVILVSSTLSGTKEIVTVREVWSEPRSVPAPFSAMPRIVADTAGRTHAFWLKKMGREEGIPSLMHSQLVARGTAWSLPLVAAESTVHFDVAGDASGTLHLAYVRATHTQEFPSGVYYTRSSDGGENWSEPEPLYTSVYFRLLSSESAFESAYVRLVAGDAGRLYVTWDDPHLERASLAYSEDGGTTWQTRPLGGTDEQPRRAQALAALGDAAWLLWEDTLIEGACALYQSPVSALLAGDSTLEVVQRVLSELTACPQPQETRMWAVGEGQVLMVAGSGSDALTLALWDGSTAPNRWSEPRRLSYSFEDPALGKRLYLREMQAALVDLPSNAQGESDDKALIVVGTDQEGEVWVMGSQMGALEMTFAPLLPWSEPVSFSQSQAFPGLPAIAADEDGQVHVLWSEAPVPDEPGTVLYYARTERLPTGETRWSRPVRVLQSSRKRAKEPALAVVDDRLHVVWSSGPSGEILYSHAFVRDAYAAEAWGEPHPLPAPSAVGSWPDLIADVNGTLHVVYAVPLNEGRGIYYTRSDDGGESWLPADQVFDAVEAGWEMVDYPRLAVYGQNVLHVVWVRASLPGRGAPQGVYYAYSDDEGLSWSDPLEVIAGAYVWPQVAVSGAGQVHLLWSEADERRAWWHQWSSVRPERVRGFEGVLGPVGLLSDGVETLHLVGLGHDDAGEPALLYTTWMDGSWGEREALRLEPGGDVKPGLAAVLHAVQGQLDVVFRNERKGEGETNLAGLWHTGRAVPPVNVPPAPTPTPQPTATPFPTSTPTPTPMPTVNLDVPPPPPSATLGVIDLPLPILGGGVLAASIVVGILVVRSWWLGRR